MLEGTRAFHSQVLNIAPSEKFLNVWMKRQFFYIKINFAVAIFFDANLCSAFEFAASDICTGDCNTPNTFLKGSRALKRGHGLHIFYRRLRKDKRCVGELA